MLSKIVVLLFAFYPFVSQGDDSKCVLAVKTMLETLVSSTEVAQFKFLESATKIPFTVDMKKRISRGMNGEVYELSSINGLEIPGLDFRKRWIVKLPLRSKRRFCAFTLPHSVYYQNREAEIYKNVIDHISLIEHSKEFPSNPYWGSGSLPVVPTEFMIRTQKGPLLIKPLVEGKNVRTLLQNANHEQIKEIHQQLENIFQLGQAMHEVIRVRGKSPIDPGEVI